MKIITSFYAMLLAVLFFSSCQKGITDVTLPATSSARIKTYTEDITISGSPHSVTTFNLSYDGSGRLISMVSANSTGDKFVYQYSAGSFTLDLYNSNALNIHEIFFLNSSSYVDSSFQYNDTQDTMTEKYIYNTANQQVQLKQYDYKKPTGAVLSNTHNYVWDANGNITSDTDLYTVYKYDYYPTLISDVIIGPLIVSKTKNLVKTTTYTSGGSTDVLHHTYNFDSSNRLVTETITVDGSTDVYKKIYTYY